MENSNELTEIVDAVCVDVIELGVVPTDYGDKNQVKFVFEINKSKDNGYRHCVSRTFNISFHEKSSLRAALKGWRARDLNKTELINGIDLKSMRGEACQLSIGDAVSQKTGNAYLKVTDILPASEIELVPSGSYKRYEAKCVEGGTGE